MTNKALLIVERPWSSLSDSPQQCSVLPFFQSMERMGELISVYYTSFFEREGFRAALNHLMGHNHKRAILYVAAHGDGIHLTGNDGAPNLRLTTALAEVFAHAKVTKNLDGVIVGSCFLGTNEATIEALFEGTGLRWVVAYQAAVEWLPSMLVDMKIVSHMACLEEKEFCCRAAMIEAFAEALSLFNPVCEMAEDEDEERVQLKDAVRIWIRSAGKGNHRVYEITDEVAVSAWGFATNDQDESSTEFEAA